jgi:hypothetical protein
MPKFKAAPEAPELELTPNREAMKSLNEGRVAAAAEVGTLRNRMASLARLRDAIAPIEAELAALDAAEVAALADWSAAPDAPAPEPDIAAREAIVGRLTAARQRVAGADAATISVEHALGNANTRAVALEGRVPAYVAAVLVDEARSLLPGITEATAAVAKLQTRYSALRTFLLDRAEAARDVAMRNGFFRDLEALDREARDAAGNAPPPNFNATLEWREMAASLGDVSSVPSPTPVMAFAGMPAEDKWINS